MRGPERDLATGRYLQDIPPDIHPELPGPPAQPAFLVKTQKVHVVIVPYATEPGLWSVWLVRCEKRCLLWTCGTLKLAQSWAEGLRPVIGDLD